MKYLECQDCRHFHTSIFRFCQPEEVDEINYSRTVQPFKKGQLIFQEGGRPLGLYHIYEGRVKVYRHASGGNEQLIRVARDGSLLGHYSFLTSNRYQISAMAVEDSEICLIPMEVIKKIFNANDNFRASLIEMLTSDIQASYGRLADLSYKPVKGRIAETLLNLMEVYSDSDQPEKVINISRTDLAGMVGTVKETAIRVLKDFKEDNLISTDKSDIIILDPEGLARISRLYD